MHQAYNVYSILKQSVHIESIAAYDNNVILGTRSGQLIMYSVQTNEPDGKINLQLLKFNKNFSKKAINQMEVIAEENLLFILTDGMIHVCDISRLNFAFIHSSVETKGSSIFVLDVKTPKSQTGATATVIRMCVAIKRRLQFYYWKQDRLHPLPISIELKDVPKALCWIDDIICVGFKDEYVIYNISSNIPEKHDLIVTSSSHSVDPCICVIKNLVFGVSKDEYLVAIDPKDFVKFKDSQSKSNKETAVSGGEAKTSLKPLTWSSSVLDLVWDEPFAIGRIANGVEVRCLESSCINKDTLVQSIPELGKVKFLIRSGKGTIFAAAISELWYIQLVDIPTQRQNLLQQKKFQLAIELTNISDEPEEIKADTIRQIHTRYAKELFANMQFSVAMNEFEKAQADPYDVIRLFPNLVQDQSKTNPPMESVNIPVLEDKDLENALMALIDFLAVARQKEIHKLSNIKGPSKSSLLSIIDTTLLKCYLQTNDSLVAPLLRLKQCHLEESEKTLKKHDKISELIILYQTNGKHKKALELLQAQASIEGSSLYGHERTIRYLQSLGADHKDLIFEFSNWVLRKHPEDGLKIFTEDFIEVENLPRAKVLDFLLVGHKNLVIPYLEHIVNVWNEPITMFHNILVKQYREKVQILMKDLEQTGSEGNSEKLQQLETYRSKMYDFLKKSDKYSPETVLQELPTNILLEERALILGKLKKHEKVLAIYIQILGNVEKASEYCEEVYPEENDIFAMLLKTILNPLSVPPYPGVDLHPDFLAPNSEIVLQLLNKYAVNINPAKVWPYLPEDMPLHRLRNYMETVIRTQMERKRHHQILKGLLTAECLRLQEQRMHQEKKCVTITDFSICPVCKKRFTNQSAFVRYPNGEIVHLSCHDKQIGVA
ncbi:vam6/Vps39-like protein [Eupeodes corollae]|uniref:vam6/Vps39-like protein n=1 Tax=Eupeodes corollae TaxID=290404 RepID=UPI002492A19C|nr:vam6/Vps39-like protein [Eupeodes corollae]